MVYRGHVKRGVIVADPRKSPPRKQSAKLRRGLMKFAGKAQGLPADASENIDHYLYGHPKQ